MGSWQIMSKLIRAIIIVLAVLGMWGVGNISLSHWSAEETCPMLGPAPACYLILAGYTLMFASMFAPLKISLPVFIIGWTPVILLALAGVVGELTATLSCPASSIGIPKCYFSALLSAAIGLLYWCFYHMQKTNSLQS